MAVNSALRRLFFLSSGAAGVRRGSTWSCDGTLASVSSGMLSTVGWGLRLFASVAGFFFGLSSLRGVVFSAVGDDVDEGCDETIQDLRRSLESERAGEAEAEGKSASLAVSLGVFSALRSAEGSLLREKERKREERRVETVGRRRGISRAGEASSDEGLEPAEELSEPSASFAFVRSSSPRPLTRGKYVYEAAFDNWERSVLSLSWGGGPTSEEARLRPLAFVEKTSWPRRAGATAAGMAAEGGAAARAATTGGCAGGGGQAALDRLLGCIYGFMARDQNRAASWVDAAGRAVLCGLRRGDLH